MMTKDTLTLGSTDLSEHVQSITVDVAAPRTVSQGFTQTVGLYPAPEWATKMVEHTWQSVNDPTVRPEHHDLSSKAFVFDCTATTRSPSFVQSVGRLKRCRCYADDIFTRKVLRTYPKRMSRAKRKEARAREQRRRINDNQWWSKR